ncbi:hypothetical protein BTA51_04780 [Hahella sp. CCB-MM4]|uniref:hypothetical protein n=1 Tax=Hahella sp. (strain CCB-MM4) TaxID=1926491 RepID=UPI000B9C6C42|nr:hypothetical protein [Hahella sp. CCB-MM4]OZG74330.1 hypothetical protein BTA51_04780 [Hahella sp. CCB-MM4]
MKLLISITILMSLVGCSRWFVITAEQKENKTYFSSEDVLDECNNLPIYVVSVTVSRKDCANDCVYWEVVDDQLDTEIKPTDFPFVYGEPVPGRTTRVEAKDLLPGQYHISGSMGCEGFLPYVNGDFGVDVSNGAIKLINLE